jgi:antitoxin MazE
MKTKVSKWGDSLAVRIPAKAARDAGIGAGSVLEVTAKAGQITLVPEKTESLAALVARITPENRHREIDWGAPVGNELI